MYKLSWDKNALKFYNNIKDKKTLKKINELIKDILTNGYNAKLGKLEILKGDFKGFASVRIDKKNRIIFTISNDEVYIVSCMGHYNDK